MLNRLLSEHAAGCFYSDEKVAEHLWQSLSMPIETTLGNELQLLQEKCYQLLTAGVDAHYPREFRLTDIRSIASNILGPLGTCRFNTRIDYIFVNRMFKKIWDTYQIKHSVTMPIATDHNLVSGMFITYSF